MTELRLKYTDILDWKRNQLQQKFNYYQLQISRK